MSRLRREKFCNLISEILWSRRTSSITFDLFYFFPSLSFYSSSHSRFQRKLTGNALMFLLFLKSLWRTFFVLTRMWPWFQMRIELFLRTHIRRISTIRLWSESFIGDRGEKFLTASWSIRQYPRVIYIHQFSHWRLYHAPIYT